MPSNIETPTRVRSKKEIRRLSRVEPKYNSVNSTVEQTRYPVLPRLINSLSHFIAGINASFPKGEVSIKSMTIKDDKVFIRYRTSYSQPEEDGSLVTSKCVTAGGLCILNIFDGRVREQLDSVYQIET